MTFKQFNLVNIEYRFKAEMAISSFFDNSKLGRTITIFLLKSFTLGRLSCILFNTFLDI